MAKVENRADALLSASVWLVDDELFEANRFKRLLVQMGYEDRSLVILSTVREAKDYLASGSAQPPALALVGLGLSDGDSGALIAQLRAQYQMLLIVVTSAWTSYDEVFDALSMGAQGYIFKERDDWEISIALRQMMLGEAIIEPIIAQRMLTQFSSSHALAQQVAAENQLSQLERSVLVKVTEGLCNREVAQQLDLDRETVNACIQNAFRKLSFYTPN